MRITAIGDCGIDRYVDLKVDRPGGISLNFAANAKDWFEPGDEIGVLTALGDDREAGIVERAIGSFGIAAAIGRRRGVTPVQYIDHDPAGERLFVRYEAGALAEHRLGSEEHRLLARSEVMIATVFTQILDFFETVASAPVGGIRALDYCNLGSKQEPLAYVRHYAERFDIGFLGIGAGETALIDELERIARAARKLFIVTLGPAGSVALGGAGRIYCRAAPVEKVVDTTGAGDSFAAGFLAAYARSRDVRAALEKGSLAAARTLGRVGAFPAELTPWPADAPAEWTALRRA